MTVSYHQCFQHRYYVIILTHRYKAVLGTQSQKHRLSAGWHRGHSVLLTALSTAWCQLLTFGPRTQRQQKTKLMECKMGVKPGEKSFCSQGNLPLLALVLLGSPLFPEHPNATQASLPQRASCSPASSQQAPPSSSLATPFCLTSAWHLSLKVN